MSKYLIDEIKEYNGSTFQIGLVYRPDYKTYMLSINRCTIQESDDDIVICKVYDFNPKNNYKEVLLSVKRASKKAETEALNIAEHKIDEILERMTS